MSATATIGGFLACLLFCPTPGAPPAYGEPQPTLRGTPYDCSVVKRELPASQIWTGRFAGQSDTGDRTIGISLVGCFHDQAQCQFFLHRMDGYIAGRVILSSCRRGAS